MWSNIFFMISVLNKHKNIAKKIPNRPEQLPHEPRPSHIWFFLIGNKVALDGGHIVVLMGPIGHQKKLIWDIDIDTKSDLFALSLLMISSIE